MAWVNSTLSVSLKIINVDSSCIHDLLHNILVVDETISIQKEFANQFGGKITSHVVNQFKVRANKYF